MKADGLVVKHTGPKGYGIFAPKNFSKGALLATASGPKIKDTDRRLTHRAVQIGQKLFIEPKRRSAIWYLNHSCSPNAYIDGDKLLARKPIKKGEEITADYSLFTNFKSWDMECHCRNKNCRKMILPYQRLKTKPKKFISAYVLS